MPDMDEASVRAALERAVTPEPPLGPLARDPLRAGLRLHRRRRVQVALACAAVLTLFSAIAASTVRNPRRQDKAAAAAAGA
jgi:hypothetical protein